MPRCRAAGRWTLRFRRVPNRRRRTRDRRPRDGSFSHGLLGGGRKLRRRAVVAGIEYTLPDQRFDGGSATVEGTKAFAGIVGTEHVSGGIGIGDFSTTHISVGPDGYRDGPVMAFSYEYSHGGHQHWMPIPGLVTPLHVRRRLRIRRIGGIRWEVDLDGRALAEIPLPGSERGLRYPRARLSSMNETLPCNNEGGFRFTHVLLLPHGRRAWTHFPLDSAAETWPGYTLRLNSLTSFDAASR